jgi:hypothetical protein
MPPDNNPPLPLQEVLDVVKLSPEGEARRFMGLRAAHLPGSDFVGDKLLLPGHNAAFGGHVYAQAALAVTRAWREMEDERGAKLGERLDLHVRTSDSVIPTHLFGDEVILTVVHCVMMKRA